MAESTRTLGIIRELAKKVVSRVEGLGVKGSKRRTDMSLDIFVGATICAGLIDDKELERHLLNVTVLDVSIRGYSAVEKLAMEDEVTG